MTERRMALRSRDNIAGEMCSRLGTCQGETYRPLLRVNADPVTVHSESLLDARPEALLALHVNGSM